MDSIRTAYARKRFIDISGNEMQYDRRLELTSRLSSKKIAMSSLPAIRLTFLDRRNAATTFTLTPHVPARSRRRPRSAAARHDGPGPRRRQDGCAAAHGRGRNKHG